MPFTDKPTMVVGIDVFHKLAAKKKSTLAFCATIDKSLSKYWTCVVIQEKMGQEIGTQIQPMMENALEEFKKVNGIFPQRIIVYRDGISTGQRETCKFIEVGSIENAIKIKDSNIKLAFVCVSKRENAKFYYSDNLKVTPTKYKNPEPGTIVDEPITNPENSFYLVSHKSPQGIPVPTQYYILSNNLSDDKSQILQV